MSTPVDITVFVYINTLGDLSIFKTGVSKGDTSVITENKRVINNNRK